MRTVRRRTFHPCFDSSPIYRHRMTILNLGMRSGALLLTKAMFTQHHLPPFRTLSPRWPQRRNERTTRIFISPRGWTSVARGTKLRFRRTFNRPTSSHWPSCQRSLRRPRALHGSPATWHVRLRQLRWPKDNPKSQKPFLNSRQMLRGSSSIGSLCNEMSEVLLLARRTSRAHCRKPNQRFKRTHSPLSHGLHGKPRASGSRRLTSMLGPVAGASEFLAHLAAEVERWIGFRYFSLLPSYLFPLGFSMGDTSTVVGRVRSSGDA